MHTKTLDAYSIAGREQALDFMARYPGYGEQRWYSDALRDCVRVTSGGAVALSTCEPPERKRFLGILVDALAECEASGPRGAPAGPDPYRFADDDQFRGLLRRAGCEDVEIRCVSLTHRVGDVDELWRGLLGGSVRTAALMMRHAPGTRRRIRAAVERLAQEFRMDGGLVVPACAKIAVGRKP